MFELLSFSHLYLLFYFLAFEFVNVKYTFSLYTSTSVSPLVVGCCFRSAILDFGNLNFLKVWALKRLILHNRAKFREDLSIRCCDIAIYVVFQDDDRRHLDF